MPSVLVLQHHEADPPAAIATALQAGGFRVHLVRAHDGQPIPASPGDVRASAVVTIGGPMSADDTRAHPFLLAERRLLEAAVRARVPVLGVCLGGQLLASVLGAEVRRSDRKEIGWHPTSLTPDAAEDPLFAGEAPTFVPFHWHGDLFEAPPGAVSLARSALTPVQAFRHGDRAYGLQFHLETNHALVRTMLASFPAELAEEGIDPAQILGEGETFFPPMEALAARVFGRWVASLASLWAHGDAPPEGE
jgi:GMP synthase (glutamine-hydrolysing)